MTGTGRGMVPPGFDAVSYMEKRAAADQALIVSPAPAQAVVDELKRLRAEVDRLRAALEWAHSEMLDMASNIPADRLTGWGFDQSLERTARALEEGRG